MLTIDYKKKMADSWFSHLLIRICKSFEHLENNKLKFHKRDWYKKNIKDAIQSITLEENDLLVITGSLYLSGEFLNLN